MFNYDIVNISYYAKSTDTKAEDKNTQLEKSRSLNQKEKKLNKNLI